MKLAYLDRSLEATGPPVVALHREGINSTAHAEEFAMGCGRFSRVAVPTGEYAFYPSGMSIGGTCWYRILPGFAGTDPISLTTAVVEVSDLLADLALDRPVLIGWGQGAVVALGAGLWQGDAVGGIVCVDAWTAHISLLPSSVLASPVRPRVLLAATDARFEAELDRQRDFLAGHEVASTTWCWSGEPAPEVLDKALADRIGRWLDDD